MARRFAAFASDHEARAPLYARLARYAASHAEIAALLLQAPPTQRTPVLLFAAVHDLRLAGKGTELALFYPNLTTTPADGDPGPAFSRFVAEHTGELAETVATRHTQTNEIGRCALLLPALAGVADEVGPLALLDVGASAGLTLLLDRYHYVYEPGGAVGGPGAPLVLLECDTRGPVPVPTRLPTVAGRLGLDPQPVDVTDSAAARWLAACVWPDQADRFARLSAALELARRDPPEIMRADALGGLAAGLDRLGPAGHPVVTTTWVLCYLPIADQGAFVAELDRLGTERDLTWVSLESPALTPGLGLHPVPEEHRSVLHVSTWRAGRRTTDVLAVCHPHGYWMYWA
jgi:hypothetical protein